MNGLFEQYCAGRGVNMLGVFNGDNRLVKSFEEKEDAEIHAEECNHRMQSCGFYVKEI